MGNEVKNRNTKEVVMKDGEATQTQTKANTTTTEKKTETQKKEASKAAGTKIAAPGPVSDWDLVTSTFQPYLYPLLAVFFLAIALRPYSVASFNDLLTDKYLLFGFENLEKLRKHVVDNVIGSCVWGFTYLYVRRGMNPEFRKKITSFVQDGFYGALATFATNFLKTVVMNFLGK